VLLITAFQAFSQDHDYDLTLIGSLTTSSKLFHHPNDPDEFIRSQFLPLDNVFSIGIDLRRRLEPIDVQIGLSVEYLSKTESFNVPISGSRFVPARDGYVAIPIELSGYFFIPVGDENFRFYMGGGGGVYLGNRRYNYAGVVAQIVERNVGYGIHILSGVRYALTSMISIRSELKFRNVQFETVNKFTQSSITYLGSTIYLDQEPLPSRISIDGMTVNAGLVFHF